MRNTLCLAVLIVIVSCQSDEDLKSVPNGPFLKSVTWYQEAGEDNFLPGERSDYTYSAGQLLSAKHSYYDTEDDAFKLRSTETFTYNKGVLMSITEKFEENDKVNFVSYEYKNNALSKILIDDDINTTISITSLTGDTLQAHYSHSNGRSFTYRFCKTGNNIVYEETWNDSGKKSSETVNEFDGKINPYSLLGYVDPMFSYFSKSNKTKTESKYFSDAFPEAVPAAYTYEYLDNQLPSEQVITYKSYPNGSIIGKGKRVFEYQ